MTSAVILLSISMLPGLSFGQPPKNHAAAPTGKSKNEYVGSSACSPCHSEIYREFSQTSMGRSMSPITPAFIKTIPSSAAYVNPQLQRRFEVFTKDGKLYQSESGTDADGKESFRDAHELQWVIGAGVNGFGTILEKDNHLFQAPLSFYSKPMSWEPSPGYELTDLGFNRPITPGCISCHSGRPNAVPGSTGEFERTPFSELAIGCERCHGPGAAHVALMSGSPVPRLNKGAPSNPVTMIVNPAHLTPYMADNICMACHQAGDVRVLKPGKTYKDIRPGSPLDDTLSILMVPPTRESPPSEDHVDHYYSMTLSKCYRASKGRLRCISCHDPHVEPTREEAPAYFNSKCLTCHTSQSCKLSLEVRMQQKPANNCIGCHMPQRDIQVISHSSATNHRIVATPDEPFPDVTFTQTTAALPDLIHINPAHLSMPGQQAATPLPLLTLLQAYGELAENKPQYVASYLKVLGQLEQAQPDNPLVQAALGRRDLKSGDFVNAVGHLRHSVETGQAVATTYADLADALTHLGQTDEARPLIEKAIQLDPFNPVTRKMLVVNLIEAKQYPKAQKALEDYLEVFPQDSFMRQMLNRAEGTSPHP
ncbi:MULTISPECIES: tetratricopeptide repeat protein [Acidobacteriaceae]|uniref:tetratricopeptide repeat protein n=1 Tax=Acidobacteriaceae TaxID=204434 RepID=UPI001C202100|nr:MULTISPECIES: tetratricopeptide repeat protein [Acidobacteriaceae]